MFQISHTDDEELLHRNYSKFVSSGIGPDNPQDVEIWEYIKDFCTSNNHVPSVDSLMSHFQRNQKIEVLDRLESFKTITPITRGNFEKRLEDIVHVHLVRQTTEILKDAGTVIQTGLEVGSGRDKKILRGPRDAIHYIMDKGHDIIKPLFGSRLSGEVTKDGDDFKKEYEKIEADPLAGIGQFTGIRQLDELDGAKRGELWTHAAFTGGLKSTLAFNWMYNQAVYFRHSSLMFSLEMPYAQCRRILNCLHSYNGKFQKIRMELGLQPDPEINTGLDYKKVKTGKLSEAEKHFLFEYVIPDFQNPENNYGEIFIEQTDPNKNDFTMLDLRAKAELIYSKNPYTLLIIDHMGLLASSKNYQSTTERINEVVRDAKRLAMNFRNGLGMAVVGLFQISREGFKSAEKNEGRYNLTHLSYANEAERSSDIVTTSYLDDALKKMSLVQFQCLKSRDDAPFEIFRAQIEWYCRRIKTFEEVQMTELEQEQIGDDLDSIL